MVWCDRKWLGVAGSGWFSVVGSELVWLEVVGCGWEWLV